MRFLKFRIKAGQHLCFISLCLSPAILIPMFSGWDIYQSSCLTYFLRLSVRQQHQIFMCFDLSGCFNERRKRSKTTLTLKLPYTPKNVLQ